MRTYVSAMVRSGKRVVRSKAQLIRFGIVGAINTGTDIGLYTVLITLGHAPWLANIISTSFAMALGYLLHRHFTFRAHHQSHRQQAVRFVTVTLMGLWVLQPVVIYAVRDGASWLLHISTGLLALNVAAKACATGASLIWNYLLYKHVVFAAQPTPVIPAIKKGGSSANKLIKSIQRRPRP